MKKLFLLLAIVVSLVSCSSNCNTGCQVEDASVEVKVNKSILERVEEHGEITIFRDRETNVMYLVVSSYQYGMSCTVMINPDGTPKLYKK